MKKLYRSNKEKMLAGVFGGIGEYFSIDPTLLRVGFVLLVILTAIFPGIIAYIIMAIIIPQSPVLHVKDK
jgi:phage shock protein C